ncbi:MAG: alpha/beta hydrolase [Pseudomonadota bacterium]
MRVLVITALALVTACSTSEEPISDYVRCEVGVYRMPSGGIVDIGVSGSAQLRWRTLDGRVGRLTRGDDDIWSGTSGWTTRDDPARIRLGDCADKSIEVAGIEGLDGRGSMMDFVTEDVRFEGAGVELAGRLVLPASNTAAPLAVLVHGSEDYSAIDYNSNQRLLPAQGVAVFVYDKRGTGTSNGSYSQDFELLAGDAAAAHRAALRLAGDRVSYSGYLGGSQGGWVAPLAATMSPASFVVAAYGMAEGPLAEDRDEVQLRLREAGFGETELAKAREITDITGRLLASDFEDGQDELAQVRAAYSEEPWFGLLEGGISWEMVSRPLWQFRIGYFFLDRGTSWEYEPVPVLESLNASMLWVLAGQDRSAPSTQTRRILTELQAEGLPIDVAFFPETDHGIVRFIEDDDGERQVLGYAQGYHELLADWIKNGRLAQAYGSAELTPRSTTSDSES